MAKQMKDSVAAYVYYVCQLHQGNPFFPNMFPLLRKGDNSLKYME